MSKVAEMSKMNADAEMFNGMSVMEQQDFIKDVYVNVRRYTHSTFIKLGRQLQNTLQRDVMEGVVQDVTFSLVTTLKEGKFEQDKAKFSTVLATYVKNRIYREGYLERMPKRRGIVVPLVIENEDGTEMEWLQSDDNVEESVLENIEKSEKKKMVDEMLSVLKPREQLVVRMRMEDKTLEEIGQTIGVTRERVRQILEKTFSYLRENNKLNVS